MPKYNTHGLLLGIVSNIKTGEICKYDADGNKINNTLRTGISMDPNNEIEDTIIIEDGGTIKNGMIGKWNVQKAITNLNANSRVYLKDIVINGKRHKKGESKKISESAHICAYYVRMAIESGGVSFGGKQPVNAWQYKDFLPKVGWACVVKGKGIKTYSKQIGDVCVMTKHGSTSHPGHICMWNGAHWVSDFVQTDEIPYNPKGDCGTRYFRFKG